LDFNRKRYFTKQGITKYYFRKKKNLEVYGVRCGTGRPIDKLFVRTLSKGQEVHKNMGKS